MKLDINLTLSYSTLTSAVRFLAFSRIALVLCQLSATRLPDLCAKLCMFGQSPPGPSSRRALGRGAW